ncbi:hypothetical protein Amsp01_090410 [Amycolatopsis sp. NBRC 101858]|uniref:YaaC family protein n=1 Tax=Amycolatopsis sp. NBRC 101858 TaxID=3032200 RepID=UPI0024A25E46|nr:hypothetical protein [Amycolatopsis sp. NBRC 101858]GLY43018.1 hypothetical protein Amsp01_090410 [Amycolatopsis sp. NBRC 101858]
MHSDSVATVWDALRATRWSPPGSASSDQARRGTYVSALEQAEQLFRAAAGVGTAARPLLAFYGLSQAGRAISAASSLLEWELKGHGVKTIDLAADLPSVRIKSDPASSAGSFARLSTLLDSPLWGNSPIALNELWDLLPENDCVPLLDRGQNRRTPLWIGTDSLWIESHPLAVVPVVGFPAWLVDGKTEKSTLDDYLAAYPGARDYHSFRNLQGNPNLPAFTAHKDGRGELQMNWLVRGGESVDRVESWEWLTSKSRLCLGTWYFFPAIGQNPLGLHPLMAWWAILHALSMLARYQPGEWASHIDVNRSSYAMSVERLLRRAVDVVPRLVLETLHQFAL